MKLTILLLLFPVSIAMGIAQQNDSHALVGVTIFNGDSADMTDMTILVENGNIAAIFKRGTQSIPNGTPILNLKGNYVIPGLIDTHVHMGMKGISRSTQTSREEFRRWVYSGVTAIRDMGGDARVLKSENQLIQNNELPGPDIYFSATVGSSDMIAKDLRLRRVTQGIGIDKAGYVIEAKDGMDIENAVEKAVHSEVSGLKFYAGIKASLLKEMTDKAHEQGLKSWAHFTVFPDRPIDVVRAGVDVVSHVWGAFWQDKEVDPSEKIPFTDTEFENARSAVFPRDLSLLNTDSPELMELFEEMKKRAVIWDLTFVVPNPAIQQLYKKYALAASRAGVLFSTGTDYFNDNEEAYPALFTEIETLVAHGILDSRQVLIAATLNGAMAIGIEKTHGSIEVGKFANLVVLKKNPINTISNIREIEFTMKNGIVYYRNEY